MIDRLAWINLDHRKDRKEHMEAAIQGSSLLSGCREIVRHAAIPPAELVVPRSFPHGAGHYSCTVAHKTVLHQACLDGVAVLLVLEDDADPRPELERSFHHFIKQVPSDWLGIWLGGYHQRRPVKLRDGLCRARGIAQAHAYLLNREGIERSYDWLCLDPLRVVDQIYWRMHAALPRFYAPEPFLIGTITGYSDSEGAVVPGL